MPLTKENIQKALEELRKNKKKRNFKESLELIIKLKELDLKKPENRINQTIILPHDIGKSVKVCVIATGQLALKSKEANADLVLGKDQLTDLGNDKKAARKLGVGRTGGSGIILKNILTNYEEISNFTRFWCRRFLAAQSWILAASENR